MEPVVVALGGNALVHPKGRGTLEEQTKRLEEIVACLKTLAQEYSIVLTHGNGPQVGNLLIQQESSEIPRMSLDTLDAMTQGQIGYWIQQAIVNILKKKAVSVITRVLVDKRDPAFRNPTKPVGPYFPKRVYRFMIKEPEGWRRVVPSPKPVDIIEIEEITSLVKEQFVVIACGGGGIPVVKNKGRLMGIEAVIDKDYSSAKLATLLNSKQLIFLTDVPYVYLGYGRSDERPLRKISKSGARNLLKSVELGEGSMKPKIEASVGFLDEGGGKVKITTAEGLLGKEGTIIE